MRGNTARCAVPMGYRHELVQTLIDFERAPAFAIALTDPVGDATVREGLLVEGPQGWGEFSPPGPVRRRTGMRRWSGG